MIFIRPPILRQLYYGLKHIGEDYTEAGKITFVCKTHDTVTTLIITIVDLVNYNYYLNIV